MYLGCVKADQNILHKNSMKGTKNKVKSLKKEIEDFKRWKYVSWSWITWNNIGNSTILTIANQD